MTQFTESTQMTFIMRPTYLLSPSAPTTIASAVSMAIGSATASPTYDASAALTKSMITTAPSSSSTEAVTKPGKVKSSAEPPASSPAFSPTSSPRSSTPPPRMAKVGTGVEVCRAGEGASPPLVSAVATESSVALERRNRHRRPMAEVPGLRPWSSCRRCCP